MKNHTGDDSIVKPGMQEYHTGHIPKPQFPTIKGSLDTAAVPQTAEFGMIMSVAPRVQTATVWVPLPPKYTRHYSKVESYYQDLNKFLEPKPDDED